MRLALPLAGWMSLFLALPLHAAQRADAMSLHDDVDVLDTGSIRKHAGAAATKVQAGEDRGNIGTLTVDGDYSRALDQPRLDVARAFYDRHPDRFDFLIAFTTFEFDSGDAVAFYRGVRNDVRGIGMDTFDHSALYGSAGRLQGYIDMAALSRWSFNSRSDDFRQPLNTLAHELLHRWSVRLRYEDAQGASRDDLLGRDGAHWNLFAATDASIMYGARWESVQPGRWTVTEARQRLGWWDLYLAGFASLSELPDIALIRSNEGDRNALPQVGYSVAGTVETVTPAQVIAAEGARVPQATEAPRHFDAAMLLLHRPGERVSEQDLAKLERFRLRFERYFQSITRGRATISLHLVQRSTIDAGVPAPLAASTISPRPAPITSALDWLALQQRGDGHWQDRDASATRDTSTVLTAITEIAPQASSLTAARLWLQARQARNLDDRAWLQRASPSMTPAVTTVLNDDGGLGLATSWRSSPFDATHVLSAERATAARAEDRLDRLADYLVARQNSDGSFGPTAGGAGRVAVAAAAAEMLLFGADGDARAAGARAQTWLHAQVEPGLVAGRYSLNDVSELLLRAGTLELPASARIALAQHLLARQGVDGDWGGSVYTTALAALALTVESRPNLAPVAAVAAPSAPVRGENVRLRLRVANRGGQSAAESSLRWYDGDPETGGSALGAVQVVDPLLAGEERVIDTWISTATMTGVRELHAVIDEVDAVEETREDDNRLRLPLVVAAAPVGVDLTLDAREMQFTPAQFDRVPSTVVLTGRIVNLGATPAASVLVRAEQVRANGVVLLAQTSLPVDATGAAAFELSLPIAHAETHRIRVSADPANVIDEAREDNNSAETLLPFAESIDLEAIAASLEAEASPRAGRDTRIALQVANRGTVDAPQTTMRLERWNGSAWSTLSDAALTLAAGQQSRRELVWRPGDDGPQTLRLRVDPDDLVAERDEANNTVEFTRTVVRDDAAALSIVAGSLVVSPQPLLQGGALQVQATVRNSGGSDASAFAVALYRGDPQAGGQRLATTPLPALAAASDSQVTLSVDDYTVHGDATLYVVADSEAAIAELDETDNVSIVAVTALSLPDLAVGVASIVLTPSSPVPGAPLAVEVEIANLGEQPAATTPVRVFEIVDGTRREAAATQALSALAPGARQTVRFEWTFAAAGTVQAVAVQVDELNALRESDETNNEATRLVESQAATAFVTQRYFSPNGDGVKDRTQAVFTEATGVVSVVAVDAPGSVRREIALEDLGGGAIGATWDGFDARGRVVVDGRYRLSARDADGAELAMVDAIVDTDAAMALEAVGTPDAVLRELPESLNPWRPGLEGQVSQDFLYAAGHGTNEVATMRRGVVRTHALFGGVDTILTGRWLDTYAASSGLMGAEVSSVNVLPDGRLLIGIDELGGANRTLLFTMHPSEIDRPVLLAALGLRLDVMLSTAGAAGPWIIHRRDGLDAWLLDAGAGTATEMDLASATSGYDSGFRLSAVLPDGVLIESPASGAIFAPFDTARPPQVVGGGDRSGERGRPVVILPGTSRVLRHDRRFDATSSQRIESVTLLDLGAGTERELHQVRLPFEYSEEGPDPIDYFALRAYWLERERVAIVVDHEGRQVLRFDDEGRALQAQSLPPSMRTGEYASSDDSQASQAFPGEGAGASCDCGDAGSLHGRYESWALSDIGFESRVFDPVSSSLFVSAGEIVAHRYEGWYIQEGIADYIRAPAHGVAQRDNGLTALPLRAADDQFAYAYVAPDSASRAPAHWPQFIHRNGSRLRTDGRVDVPATGRTTSPWQYASRLHSLSASESRAWLRQESGTGIGAAFSTLGRLTSALRASSDGRAVRLSGLATDRNFDHFRIDWAPVSAPDQWQVLLPPNSEQVRFDEFVRWAPPAAGAFVFRLRVADRAGNVRDSFATAELAFSAPISNVRQNLRSISPNGDAVQDAIDVDFQVLRPTTQTIEVRDAAGRTQRRVEFTFGESALGAQRWTWDGRNDGGARVADGRYRIEFSSGFGLRVDVDVVAPAISASLTHADDPYDGEDLRRTVRSSSGLGPMVDFDVDERFAGAPVSPDFERIESAPIGSNDWVEVLAYRQLQFGETRTQAFLSAQQYAGRRFRVVAGDVAGNRASAPLGDSEGALLLLHADTLAADYLPQIQAPPRGQLDAIPGYSIQGRAADPAHRTPIAPGIVPLFALDLGTADAGGNPLEELIVDELRSSNGIAQWVTLVANPPAQVERHAARWPAYASHLRQIDVDLSQRALGARVPLRVRGRYADGQTLTSNALEFEVGGIELTCRFIDSADRQVLPMTFLVRPSLRPAISGWMLEVTSHAGDLCQDGCDAQLRFPDAQVENAPSDRPFFIPPSVEQLRQLLSLTADRSLLFRVAANDGVGRDVASRWSECRTTLPGQMLVMPVFGAACGATPSGKVRVEVGSLLSLATQYRVQFSSAALAQPRHFAFPVMQDRPNRADLSTATLPEGRYDATLQHLDAATSEWKNDATADFVVDHVAPDAHLIAPAPGDSVCLADWDRQVTASIDDARRVGWRIDLPNEVRACGGYEGRPPDEPECTDAFQTGQVVDFSKATPALVGAHFSGSASDADETFRLIASDWSGAQVCDSAVVDIDGDVQWLMRSPATPALASDVGTIAGIAPGSSGAWREARWFLRAREPVQWSATLYAAAKDPQTGRARIVGAPLQVLQAERPGIDDIDFAWDGRHAGVALPDGLYGVRFDATDECGNADHIDAFVRLDATAPEVAIDSPVAAAQLRAVTLPVVGRAHDAHFEQWRVELSQAGVDGPWLTLASGTRAVRSPEVLVQWATAGYTGPAWIRLSANDRLGNAATTLHPVQLLPRANLLQAGFVQPLLFSPNDDGEQDTTTLNLTLRAAASLSVRVLDSGGMPVRVLETDRLLAPGPALVVWDGRDAANAVAADGRYDFDITAAEPGNPGNADQQTFAVVVDATPPTISAFTPADAFVNCDSEVGFTTDDAHFESFDAQLLRAGDTLASLASDQPGPVQLGALVGRADGTYVATVLARDAAGNRATFERTFELDCTVPRAELLLDRYGYPSGSGITIPVAGVAADANLLHYRLELRNDDGTDPRLLVESTTAVDPGTLHAWQPGAIEGPRRLHLAVTDRAGNVTVAEASILLDATPPQVRIDAPADASVVGAQVQVVGRAFDERLESYRIELATPAQAAQDQWSVLLTQAGSSVENGLLGDVRMPFDGDYVLRVVAVDQAGLQAEARVSLRVDTTTPAALALSGATDGPSAVRLTWTAPADGDIAQIHILRNGVAIADVAGSVREFRDADAPQGELRYRVAARDVAGNRGPDSNEVALRLDARAPQVNIVAPRAGERVRSILTIDGRVAADDDDLASWTLSRIVSGTETILRHVPTAASGTLTHPWDTRELADETAVVLRLAARDRDGNEAHLDIPVVVDNLAPAPPSGVVASGASDHVQVTWNANLEPDLLGYLVYRAGALVGAGGALPADLRSMAQAANALRDVDAPDGVLGYRVYAIDLAGNISEPSDTVEVDRDVRAPDATLVRPQPGEHFESAIEVVAETPDRDVARIAFSVRAVGAPEWTDLGIALASPWRTTFDPDGLPLGEYELRALATDEGGRADPTPSIVTVIHADLTPPPAPTGVDARADGARVDVSWQPPAGEAAARYRVERQSDNRAWSSVADVAAPATQWTDAGRALGVHRYRISALDASDNASVPSSVDEAPVFALSLDAAYTPTAEQHTTLTGRAGERGGRVEYRNGSASPWSVGLDVAPFAAFTLVDLPLAVGSNPIEVTLLDADGHRSIASLAPLRRAALPAPPTNLQGTVDAGSVALDWQPSPSPDIVGYRVYRNGHALLDDTALPQTIAASAAGEPVPAVIDGEVDTGWSVSAGAASSALPPSATITLTWPQTALLSGLRLRFTDADRSASAWRVLALDPEAGWVPIALREDSAQHDVGLRFARPYATRSLRIEFVGAQRPAGTVSVIELEPQQLGLRTELSYLDSVADGNHRFEATAVDASGFESPRSLPWNVEIGDAEAPPAVTLSASASGAHAQLQWSESVALDLDRYAIHRDGIRIAERAAGEERRFVDAALANGRYRYVVIAEDTHANASPPSNAVDVDIDDDAPGMPSIVAVVQPAGIHDGLRVTWIAGNGVAPARYRLAVAAGADVSFSPLLVLDLTEYLHRGLVPGTYRYRVQALDARGNAGPWSEVVAGEVRDTSPPQQPILFVPTIAGEPITWTRPTYPVCGITTPGANVIIVRNGDPVAETTALAHGAWRALDFARGADVALGQDGQTLFVGAAEQAGWFDIDGTRTGVANTPLRQVLAAADATAFVAYRADYDLVRGALVPAELEALGAMTDVLGIAASAGGGTLLVASGADPAQPRLWRVRYGEAAVELVLPDARRVAPDSLQWHADRDEALFADGDGRIYRYALETQQVTEIGATRAGQRPHPAPVGGAWIALASNGSDLLLYSPLHASPQVLLDDGRVPLALAWSPDARRIALRFADGIEIRDALDGALQSRTATMPVAPGVAQHLQWPHWQRLLLTSADPEFPAQLLDLPGTFCSGPIAAVAGDNVIEAVAESADGLLSLPSEPLSLFYDVDASGLADLSLDEDTVRFFPAAVRTGERRAVFVPIQNEGDVTARADAIELVRATLTLPDGSRRVVSSHGALALEPWQSTTIVLDLGPMPLAGAYTLTLHADPGERIAEHDREDNAATMTFEVADTLGPQVTLQPWTMQAAPGGYFDGDVEVSVPQPFAGGELLVRLLDADGSVVATLLREPVGALEGGGRRSWFWQHEVGTDALAGVYRVHAKLLDPSGLRAERTAQVVVDGAAQIALLLQPERARATVGQTMPVLVGFDYDEGNRIFDSATLRLLARGPDGVERVLWQGATGTLLPGYRVRRTIDWPAALQSVGMHELQLQLLAGDVDRSVLRDVEFTAADAPTTLRGSLALQPSPQWVLGRSASLRAVVENPTGAALDVEYRVRVLREGVVDAALERDWSATLAAGAQSEQEVALDPLPAQPQAWLARLEARIPSAPDATWRRLASTGFSAVDGEAPRFEPVLPAAGAPVSAPTLLAARVFDRHSRVDQVDVRVDGGAWRPMASGGAEGYEAMLHGLADGTHRYELRARDAWGNEALLAPTSFVVDSTPPTIDIGGVVDGELRNTPATATIVVTDAHPDGHSAWLDGIAYIAGTPISAEGLHELHVAATDLAGNRTTRTLAFTLDATAPALAFVSPSDGSSTRQRHVTVRLATEPGVVVSLASGAQVVEATASAGGEARFDAFALQVGANTLQARGVDAAGNATDAAPLHLVRETLSGVLSGEIWPVTTALPHGQTLAIELRLDNGTETGFSALPLRVSARTAGGAPLSEELFDLALDATEARTVERVLASQDWAWGPVVIALETDSGDGWRLLDSITVTITDIVPPTVSGVAPTAGAVVSRVSQVSATAADEHLLAAVDYRIDAAGWAPLIESGGNWVAPVTLDDGVHVVRFRALDGSGNVAETGDVAFDVDGTAPQITIDRVADGGVYGAAVTPVVAMLDAHPGTLTLTLDGVTFQSGAAVTEHGPHRLIAQAIDVAGNAGTRQIDFTIDLHAPSLDFVQPDDGDIIDADRTLVLGTTEAGASVTLQVGAYSATSTAAADGGFGFADVPLASGENTVTARATDVVGNEGAARSIRVFRTSAGPTGIDGAIAATPSSVPAGADFALLVDLHERAGAARAELAWRVELRRAGDTTALRQEERTIALGANADHAATISFDSDGLVLGDHVATLSAMHDSQWRMLASAALTIVDSQPPQLAVLAPAPSSLHRGSVDVRVAVTDESALAAVEARVDGGAWQALSADSGAWIGSLVLAQDGSRLLEFRARDVPGHVATATLTVRSDTTAPTIRIDGVNDGQLTNHPVTPVVSVEDASGVSVTTTLDDVAFVSGMPVTSEGVHRLDVDAVDDAGNDSTRSLTFELDLTPPPLSIAHPLDGTAVSVAQLDIVGSAEPGALIALRGAATRDVVADASGAFVFTAVGLQDGVNAWRIQAIDRAGNTSAELDWQVRRVCGAVDLACGLFSDGFEGNGTGPQAAATKGFMSSVAPTPIPALRPSWLLLCALVLLYAARRRLNAPDIKR